MLEKDHEEVLKVIEGPKKRIIKEVPKKITILVNPINFQSIIQKDCSDGSLLGEGMLEEQNTVLLIFCILSFLSAYDYILK